MEVIVLSGKSNSGKTTILDNLYKKLKDDDFEEKMSHYTYDRKDHRVFLNGKDSNGKDINLLITTPGDNAKELLNNFLFYIDCYRLSKNIDCWILAENTKNNEIHEWLSKLLDIIQDINQEKINKDYIKTKQCRNSTRNRNQERINEDNKRCLDEILKKLNIKEVKNEVQ
ncbi:MAG: hypothetical protein SPJ08_00510 [Sphaerochaetaceae bacterium]|nr:hypothetical protein [Sphaerochaetaceae bacterium]